MATSLLEQIASDSLPIHYRLTVEQLHQMLSLGVIQDGEPIELVDGVLVQKDRRDAGGELMSHGRRHAKSVRRIGRLSEPLQALGYDVQTQLPVTLSAVSEPEPDGAIVIADDGDYGERHPCSQDIAVIFEVSDTSLRYDRTIKKAMYAAAGIRLYCIVNLRDNVIEIYKVPD
ncbi:MAG: Uma2 family endonuclease, partial [Planctomycetota bacterium]